VDAWGWRSWSILRGCSSPCQIGLVLIDRIVIVREERHLERKFGDEYLNYKRRVRHWI
jgi:protein-S-isoprenylcysteine O-methyltransferase Ste14